MMMSLARDLLSAKTSAVWIAALFAVLIFHCSHLIRMHGEHRWYHSAHIMMLLGMLYMYSAVAFGLDWLPERLWMIIYVATSAAIIGWMLVSAARWRSFGNLWILALVQQGAMIYMWVPMKDWLPPLSYAFGAYFALETIAWLTRAYIKPRPANAGAEAGGSAAMALAPKSIFGDVCMMIMAASMGYMFLGMQMMMSMPRQSRQLAQKATPEENECGPGGEETRQPPLTQAPKIAVNEPARMPSRTSPAAAAGSYSVIAGDSLGRIAARHCGEARQWRAIMKANPGLNPRRLHIGQAIKLPVACSPG
ncbi:MAG: DUF5134 domain-containing protein [Methylocapsa sp.]|nr:DUF5134 domain-containing protein [Methylocapsa sp.]